MFKPHRFNPLLKAVPNKEHEAKVASNLVHGQTHEELLAAVQTTTTVDDGQTKTTEKVVEAEITTRDTPVAGGKVETTTTVEAAAEVTTTKSAHKHKGTSVTSEVSETSEEISTTTTTEILSRVHETVEGVAGVEMTPPHPPREETPEYARAHHHLVYDLDSPCAMCGVRHSTLGNPAENLFGATALETHHYPIERSLLDACDPTKVSVVFAQVKDHASLEAFVDSEHNMMILCDIHHRHPLHGIHHLTPQDFFVQPFLWPGYQVASNQDQADKIMALDEELIKKEEGQSS